MFNIKYEIINIKSTIVLSLFAILTGLIFQPTSANAHKWAASSFSSRTLGNFVDFTFDSNPMSIMEMIVREDPKETDEFSLKNEDIQKHQKTVINYFDNRFKVTNNKKPCLLTNKNSVTYNSKDKKIQTRIRFECKKDLHKLVLLSSLFIEEETEHKVIGSFVHKYAREQYFFTGKSKASIDVTKLKQMRQSSSGYRMPTPPRGTRIAGPPPKKSTNVAPPVVKSNPPTPPVNTDDVVEAKKLESGWDTFVIFIQEGINHILSGLDHILFIFALMIAVYGWKNLAKVVTSFTIAHSITLALSALDLIRVSPVIVEPMIALSIVYVAIENIWKDKSETRVVITFIFGLIHGLGFGATLQRDLGLYSDSLITPLLGFNVGVEIGQLLVVLPLFPLLIFLRKDKKYYGKIKIITCAIITAAAGWWFVQRVIDAMATFQ